MQQFIAAVFLAALVFTALPAQADELSASDLTPTQKLLWEKTRAELEKVYLKLGRTPTPMPQAEIDAIRLPLTPEKTERGPLPWDVRLLLSFDRNLTLYYNHAPLLAGLLDPQAEKRLFLPDMLLDVLEDSPFNLFSDDEYPMTREEVRATLLKEGGKLPALWFIEQSGDELPLLWAAGGPQDCTVVLHFDYDDEPEFYVRNTSLFGYVLEFITKDGSGKFLPDTRTDASALWDEATDQAILKALRPKVERLNTILDDVLYAEPE